MKRIVAIVLLVLSSGPRAAWADDLLEQERHRDVVLRALVDELERSLPGLKLEDLERPYFIEYGLLDSSQASVSAKLGAVTSRRQQHARGLRTDVRVGSYQLDNSNFEGGPGGGFGAGEMSVSAEIPIEDDYNAIRQAIWWVTDRDYKGVVEQLVQKKAFMEGKIIEDKPDDFSRVPAAVHFDARVDLGIDLPRLEELAGTLSAIFRDYPEVQNSGVTVSAYHGNKYLVNTEGTRLRTGGAQYTLTVSASAQADDGMRLSDMLSVHARDLAGLPPLEELVRRCRKMAEQLIALKNAPTLGAYTGPVLFEAEPAAAIFYRQFGGSFGGGQRPVGSRSSPDDFANKLGKRILPRFLHVIDDPAQQSIAGVPVMGHYVYDDQAVRAERVTLVEAGRLKTLLMSRNPSKEIQQSNGHGRGIYGTSRGSIGCLIVQAEPALDADALKQELLEACADEGLEFGLRIASLGSVGDGGRRGYDGGSNPLLMYKVFPDGREELVRGAEIARMDLKTFKRMLAAGDTPHVLNTGSGLQAQTVVVPAMLFEELDLARIDRDFDKPPILPTPLARQQ